MNAYATYEIVSMNRCWIEAIVDVDSDSGWLGACRITVPRRNDIQEACYNEADRRATAKGLTLQMLKLAQSKQK